MTNTHFLTLQRQVVLAIVLFADDALLVEVGQLWVDGEFAELIARLGEEIRCVSTGCGPVRVIEY